MPAVFPETAVRLSISCELPEITAYTAQGAEADIDALPELTYPCIAFWEFNHFVVIEGYDDKKVYLNDPESGLRTVNYQEFSQGFTGVVLLFEPSPAFAKGGQKDTLWLNLRPRLQGTGKAFTFIFLACLALVIPNLMIAGFAKIFIDDVLIRHYTSWLLPLLWGMILTGLMRALLTWIKQVHLLKLHLKMVMTSSAQFLWHIFRLPMSFFTQRYSGDIASRVAANDSIATTLSHELNTNLVGLISMVFYAFIMFLYDWVLTLIAVSISLYHCFQYLPWNFQ